MRILFLPFDIASKGAITLNALNKIEGIEAKGFFVNENNSFTAKSIHAKYFKNIPAKSNPLKWLAVYLQKSYEVQKLIRWADVVHWIWDSAFEGEWDLRLAGLLKKPGIIEWSGSDIRYPERNFEINPYAHLLYTPQYEYREIETKPVSFARQDKFYKLGFVPLVTPEMDLYVKKDLFPKTFHTLHRLNVKDFHTSNPANLKPVIVHSPSKKNTKGTSFIMEAIESLREEGFDFEFRLVENTSREEALRIVQNCDIFIDQLLLGSNGMAACEALSMGKPVLCHIMQAVFDNGLPAECPIIPTHPENIKSNIAMLLKNKELRIEKGRLGRLYAEKYLDADKKAIELVSIYKEVMNSKRHRN